MYCISNEQRFECYDIDLVARRIIQSGDDERFKYLGVLEKVVAKDEGEFETRIKSILKS